jgi:hypothetical protein
MTQKQIVPKNKAGGTGILAAKTKSFVRIEEQSIRLSNLQIRKNISDSGVLELAIAIAMGGKDLEMTTEGNIVEVKDIDGEPVRIGIDAKIKLFTLLSSKLIPSVKSITVDTSTNDNDNAHWVDALRDYKNPPNGK